ncbi:DUF4402 domain-containing protein [Flavobacterium sp. K5-23]|uniref:DUF4402 domain-containing protein n=1 Tax=Flavobacterium sp. K5-23 TaxID=2746225 RepID=UPI00200E4995|nr:DUF4402 domain-containing protein [Flavobacterium sp. K5-23]UQD57335.1 DUF4402 domain-containing protein [Flavobacterium sp. K5-23]
MKNLFTYLLVFIAVGLSSNVKAQSGASVNASAGASIVVPMKLSEKNSLNFGTSTKQVGLGGSVVLSTGDASRDFNGGVSASSIGESPSNAIFEISGTHNKSYSITLPSSITIAESGSSTMIIDDLKVRFVNTTGDILINEGNNSLSQVLSDNGTSSFRLGGKLNIDSDQEAGMYSGTYVVMVDYN